MWSQFFFDWIESFPLIECSEIMFFFVLWLVEISALSHINYELINPFYEEIWHKFSHIFFYFMFNTPVAWQGWTNIVIYSEQKCNNFSFQSNINQHQFWIPAVSNSIIFFGHFRESCLTFQAISLFFALIFFQNKTLYRQICAPKSIFDINGISHRCFCNRKCLNVFFSWNFFLLLSTFSRFLFFFHTFNALIWKILGDRIP